MPRERDMRAAVFAWMRARQLEPLCEFYLGGMCDVVGFRFAERTSRRIPPLEAVVSVELKLNKIAEVIRQAKENRITIASSWCAMPAAFIAGMRPLTLDKFKDAGVGLLACDGLAVVEIIQPLGTLGDSKGMRNYEYFRANLHRKIWRRRDEQPTE